MTCRQTLIAAALEKGSVFPAELVLRNRAGAVL